MAIRAPDGANNSIQSRFKINGQSLLEDLKYASISRFHFLNVGWAVYKSGIPIWLPQGLRHNRLLIMHPSRPINTPIWRWDVTYILNLGTFPLMCRPHFQYRKGNELSSKSFDLLNSMINVVIFITIVFSMYTYQMVDRWWGLGLLHSVWKLLFLGISHQRGTT